MWKFGVGMFMVIIAPESLRLTAVYGLSTATAILIFGAHVGNMVDKVPRLSAARWTLILQNLSVAVCAVIIYFVIVYKQDIRELWPNEGLLTLCYACIILVVIVSSLASTGNTIAVERDWIVEMCGRDGDALASMSATLKGIDQTTNIMAPIATGQIMAYAGVDIGAIFIGAWNIVSVSVEYYLLWKVYTSVPALRVEKNRNNLSDTEQPSSQSADKHLAERTTSTNTCYSCLQGLVSGVTILVRGWTIFMKYDVAFAGLALSSLYMTVIGFDNVPVGYAYTQGINESIMGIFMAAGATAGIFGTILYPRLHKYFGLVRTGLFGLFLQILVASLCVASIWAPGSPFNPSIRSAYSPSITNYSMNETGVVTPANGVFAPRITFSTDGMQPSSVANVTETAAIDVQSEQISIILMLTGIVGARCGLWITDLTITQLFLTRIRETERGVVLGVQTSLNQLMDVLKFTMAIVAPEPELFGILVLVSFGFLCFGCLLYAKYARSALKRSSPKAVTTAST